MKVTTAAARAERRRRLKRDVDVARPGCSPLGQHPGNLRERLPGGADRVDEPLPIEVIAHACDCLA